MQDSIRINIYRILIGLFALLIGAGVYLFDRSPDPTYWIQMVGLDDALPEFSAHAFGTLGDILPAFAHVFAFILITAGILSPGKNGCLVIALSWLVIDWAFELGQRFGESVFASVPDCFKGIPVLEMCVDFFKNGVFDWWDMTAVLMGAGTGYALLMLTAKKDRREKKESPGESSEKR